MLSLKEQQTIRRYLAGLQNSKLSFPFGRYTSVYSVGGVAYAYLQTDKQLWRLSLRSEAELAKLLRSKYEEVLPGQKLNPRVWNTVVLSGQLSTDEVIALIDHSYQLALQTEPD